MTSIRVHELAKELNISSKEVVDKLNEMGVNVKNHLSAVNNADADKVKNAYKKPKVEKRKPEVESGEGKNMQQLSKPDEDKVAQQIEGGLQKEGRPQGSRPQGEGRPQGSRPQGEGRPQGSRPQGEGRPQGSRPQGEGRPQGSRPQGEGRPPYQPRPQGEGRPPYQSRPQGEGRPPYQPRPQGEGRPPYQPRPQGEGRPPYQSRPQGEGRPPYQPRPQGEGRPPYQPRPQGEGRPPYQSRPQGEGRPPYQPRPQGEGRPPYQSRPQGEGRPPYQPRPQGEGRPPYQSRPQGDQKRPQGGRFGDEGRKPQGQRGMVDNRKPQMQRIKIDGKITELSVSEQPLKRQSPEKKKLHDNKTQSFERKHSNEKELPFNFKKGDRNHPREKKEVVAKHIVIPESITIQELASRMSRKAGEVIKELMKLGVMATINQEIDAETATIVCTEMGVTVEVKAEKLLSVIDEIEDKEEDLKHRPPVVTVMGHVDHGKTSLLDAIRSANVTASEAGGITQHIGAYQIEIKGQKITFLDTPGHEAFTAMRARGAQVTDVAVLVVAADDGVMPQTIEAINHAKAANVPIVVAINKIDKENANPDRVKQELTEHGLVVEEWGGETIAVPVSAKTRNNIEGLLEMILLVAEMKDLKANPNRTATGTVIEAKLDKGKGPVATVLVSKGTLNIGDVIVIGPVFGKIRAMVDDKGRRVKKAGPSMPVEIQGLSEVPEAGEIFNVVSDDKLAHQISDARNDERKAEEVKQRSRISLDDLFDKIKEGEVKDLNIIIKGDVQGSVEAIKQSLAKLSTSEVRVNPIHTGVGAISESDVMLAAASNAIIIGFNVRPDANSKTTAEHQKVDIRLYRVIYEAIDDIRDAMQGMLEPEFKEVIMGKAEVRQVFKAPKIGTIAGSYITEGKISRTSKVRVIRDGIVINEGELESLRRFKDDVREVSEGYECGIGIKNFNDIKEGDILEAFTLEEIKREL